MPPKPGRESGKEKRSKPLKPRAGPPPPKTRGTVLDPQRFKRQPGKKYLDTQTGRVISYRQARQIGLGTTQEKYRDTRKALRGGKTGSERYKQLVEYRRDFLEKTTGKRPSARDVRNSPEMRAIVKDLHKRDRAARGPKARALEQLGLRDTNWTHAVGDTNQDMVIRKATDRPRKTRKKLRKGKRQ